MTSNSTEVSRAEPSGAGLTGLAPASDKSHASPQWWTGAVVYQIYPRSFQDSDGDGVGDLRGVLQRIDHLSGLGVDVVWFSPLYRSPHDDNGYDISDYQDVDPLFGDMRDLDDVIQALHARGIKVVMDLVVNHTSDEHPWFLESRSSQSNPKRDWYWWRPARHGVEPGSAGAEPTNWGSHFGGPAWEYDPATADYYLHLFSRKMPDLNWENPEVREAIYEMMRWWLDRGIDGFRMDVINLISKILTPDGSLADSAITTGPYGDHMAPTVNGPRIHEFLQEMHREVFDRYQSALLLVGETIGGTVEDAALFTDPARRELDMVFTFDHMSVDLIDGDRFVRRPLDLRDLKAALTNWQIGLAQVGWNSLYWENHDQPRIVSRFGDDGAYRRESATMLATILHLHRGTPYIYQGEELGMTNPGFTSLEEYRDIDSLNYAAQSRELDLMDDDRLLQALAFGSRDNSRTPMQWDSSPQAGFTTGEPWIAVNPNHTHINAETERADPHSVFHHYRRLIALRHTEDTVRLGDFHLLLPQDPAVYAFTRTLDGDALLVVGNFTGDHQDIDLAEMSGTWAVLVLGNYPDAAAPMSTHLRLRPWEALVLRGVTQ